jgi:hypothetical protein
MFSAELLPPVETFYRGEFRKLSRPCKGWVKVLCCFHDEKTASLSLNFASGGFYCHGCGSKGGDILDFLQLRDGISFKQAALLLGAWSDEELSAKERRKLERAKREEERIARAAEALKNRERELRMAARGLLHSLESQKRLTSERLRKCAPDSPESAAAWADLESLETRIVEQDAAYRLLCFDSAEKKARFILNQGARSQMIAEAIYGQ